jgi:hypothetical protein
MQTHHYLLLFLVFVAGLFIEKWMDPLGKIGL